MTDEILLAEQQDTGKTGILLWLSFGICFLCNLSAGLVSTLMSAYLPPVVNDLTGMTSEGELGRVSAYIQSLYIVGWAAGGFAWGFISDRIGRARALSISAGLYGAFTILISFAPSWEYVVTFRLLSGLAVGGILVITPTLLFEIWPTRTRAVMIGIDSIGFPVGIFSSGLVTLMVDEWRNAFLIGLLPIFLCLVAQFMLKESDHWKNSRESVEPVKSSAEDRAKLVRGSIIFGSMLIGLWGMFSWIPTWVQSLLTDSDGQSERGIAMMLLGGGGLTGGFLSGYVSNALGVRRAMILCFSGCIVMSSLLFGLNKEFSALVYVELALLSLFFGISQGLLSIYIPQLFPVHIRGTFTGICFNIGRIFTAMAIFFVGVMVTFFHGYGNTLLAFASIFLLGLSIMIAGRNGTTDKK